VYCFTNVFSGTREETAGEALVHRLGVKAAFELLVAELDAPRDVVVDWTVAEGPTASALLGFATESRADLVAVAKRDPACRRLIDPLLYFKGFHALETYRFSHALWRAGRHDFALYLQSLASRILQVDIHPAARIGKGVMLDHATGIVIGETAVVGDNCSLLHGVTLGGTGNEKGDRHPKIGSGVMMGSGAKILGNIKIGDCVRVAAGSVVLQDVPPRRTVAGVPAHDIGPAGCEEPALVMDQFVEAPDEQQA